MESMRVFSKSRFENQVGYCRAIKRGNFIAVSGTVAVDEEGNVFAAKNPYLQTKRCLHIIELSLNQLGASLSDIIRTRMFVSDISLWPEYGKAHAEVFKDFPPACSMIEINSLISSDFVVEIEVDALCVL